MPYFPIPSESSYKCQGCGQWYIRGNVSCCVAHTPGSCCHYGELPTLPPRQGEKSKNHWTAEELTALYPSVTQLNITSLDTAPPGLTRQQVIDMLRTLEATPDDEGDHE